MFFIPMLQQSRTSPPKDLDASLYAGALVLQMKIMTPGLETEVRKTLASIDPNLTVDHYQTFDQQIHGNFNTERMIARLTLLFGLLALVLATVGLYGVTSYTVERRTPEIGIRMALGAARRGVIGMVMRGAMLQAGIGLAIGIPTALLCAPVCEVATLQCIRSGRVGDHRRGRCTGNLGMHRWVDSGAPRSFYRSDEGIAFGVDMRRIIFLTIAVCSCLLLQAQQPSVDPPAGTSLLLTAAGDGSQVYACINEHWTLKAPDAKLLDERGQVIGTHFAGPTWRLTDGSEVKGKMIASKPSPDAGSVPWLLLQVGPQQRQRQAGECAVYRAHGDAWRCCR